MIHLVCRLAEGGSESSSTAYLAHSGPFLVGGGHGQQRIHQHQQRWHQHTENFHNHGEGRPLVVGASRPLSVTAKLREGSCTALISTVCAGTCPVWRRWTRLAGASTGPSTTTTTPSHTGRTLQTPASQSTLTPRSLRGDCNDDDDVYDDDDDDNDNDDVPRRSRSVRSLALPDQIQESAKL